MPAEVTIPTGSLIGLCLLVGLVGVVLGRTSKFMTRAGALHARVHGGNQAQRQEQASDQRVAQVVVVGRDGAEGSDAGHVRRSERVDRQAQRAVAAGPAGRGELVEGDSPWRAAGAGLIEDDDQALWELAHEQRPDTGGDDLGDNEVRGW